MKWLFLICSSLIGLSLIKGNIINTKVERTVNLESQFVKTSSNITFINTGFESVYNYIYILEPNVSSYYIKFTDNEENDLFYQETFFHLKDGTFRQAFDINFFAPLKCNETTTILVMETHINQIKPLRKKKLFSMPDDLIYEANIYYFSLYPTLNSLTEYVFYDTYTADESPNVVTNSSAFYVYYMLQEFAIKKNVFKFNSGAKFFHVLNLIRTIDVSHFGYITVKDAIKIKNAGAKVYGPFIEQKRKEFISFLPVAAQDIVLYDELGVLYDIKATEINYDTVLTFFPRYPLAGGWQTEYVVEYNVPTYEYLATDNDDNFILEMHVIDHVLNNVVIDKFTTKIILPEYAEINDTFVPNPFKRLNDELSVTGLTCFGRNTVVITGENIVENHIADFSLKYTFDEFYLLRIPAKCALYCYIIFLSVIFTRRVSNFCALQ